jgi:hypothetical protein
VLRLWLPMLRRIRKGLWLPHWGSMSRWRRTVWPRWLGLRGVEILLWTHARRRLVLIVMFVIVLSIFPFSFFLIILQFVQNISRSNEL